MIFFNRIRQTIYNLKQKSIIKKNMIDSIKIKKEKGIKQNYYVAHYETLDIIAQGDTENEALLNLLECICIAIEFAIDHNNIENLFKKD